MGVKKLQNRKSIVKIKSGLTRYKRKTRGHVLLGRNGKRRTQTSCIFKTEWQGKKRVKGPAIASKDFDREKTSGGKRDGKDDDYESWVVVDNGKERGTRKIKGLAYPAAERGSDAK